MTDAAREIIYAPFGVDARVAPIPKPAHELSQRERKCLRAVRLHVKVRLRSPTYSWLGKCLGIAATNAEKMVLRLKRRQLIAQTGPRCPRSHRPGIRLTAAGHFVSRQTQAQQ